MITLEKDIADPQLRQQQDAGSKKDASRSRRRSTILPT
jgi:hypothetical protein